MELLSLFPLPRRSRASHLENPVFVFRRAVIAHGSRRDQNRLLSADWLSFIHMKVTRYFLAVELALFAHQEAMRLCGASCQQTSSEWRGRI